MKLSHRHLIFYRRVRPSAALWKPIAGCALIYGTLFGAGKVIFKDYPTGAAFLAVALAAGLYIYHDLSRAGGRASWSERADGGTRLCARVPTQQVNVD